MKKIIGVSGIVLVGLAGALIAIAAVGDAVWIGVEEQAPDLSNPQKSAIATLINADWGTGVAARLTKESCQQRTKLNPGVWVCTVYRTMETTLTDRQYWDLRKAGKVEVGQATVTRVVEDAKQLTPARVAEYGPFAQSVFGLPMDELDRFAIERDDDNAAVIHAKYNPIKTGTVTEFRAADEADPTQVLSIIGEVAE